LQTVEDRCQELLSAIQSTFGTICMALIIDDLWEEDFDEVEALDIAMDCSSSVLVTSRDALPGGWEGWENVHLTGESNMAQQEAILASYVADMPEVTTVQPHLKVCPVGNSHVRGLSGEVLALWDKFNLPAGGYDTVSDTPALAADNVHQCCCGAQPTFQTHLDNTTLPTAEGGWETTRADWRQPPHDPRCGWTSSRG
jgi:hypothetical protein